MSGRNLPQVPLPQTALAPRFTATIPKTFGMAKVRPIKVVGTRRQTQQEKLPLFKQKESNPSSDYLDHFRESIQLKLRASKEQGNQFQVTGALSVPAKQKESTASRTNKVTEGCPRALNGASSNTTRRASNLQKSLLQPQSFSQRFMQPQQKSKPLPNQSLQGQSQKRQCSGQGIFQPQTQIKKLFKGNQPKPIENVPSFGGSPQVYGSFMQYNTRDTTPNSSQDIMNKVNEIFNDAEKPQGNQQPHTLQKSKSDSSNEVEQKESLTKDFFDKIQRDFDYLFTSSDRTRLFDPYYSDPDYYSHLIPVSKSQQCRLVANLKKTESELQDLRNRIQKLEAESEKERERDFDNALRSISLGSKKQKSKKSEGSSENSHGTAITFGQAQGNQMTFESQSEGVMQEVLSTQFTQKQAPVSNQESADKPGKKKRHRRVAVDIDRHYVCAACKKQYGSEGSLNQHIKLKHPLQTKMLIQATKQQFHGLKRDKVLVNYNQ